MSGYSNNPYANPYGPSYPGGVNNPSSSHPAASTSTAGPVYQPYAGPMQAAYTGSSDAYSAYATPSDPSARFNLLEADTHRAAFDASMAQQSSIYTPEAVKKGGFGGPGGARKTVIRKGGGETWEDQSLMEWDPAHFRLFIGDLDPALSDDLFMQSFSGVRYPSFVKSRIIRDKYTNKGKGFGFVSYSDPEDFLKAWKEMNGKYVGTRPVKISKATTGVGQVKIGNKRAREFDAKLKPKSGSKPYERAIAAELASGGPNSGRGSGGFGPEKDRKSYIRR